MMSRASGTFCGSFTSSQTGDDQPEDHAGDRLDQPGPVPPLGRDDLFVGQQVLAVVARAAVSEPWAGGLASARVTRLVAGHR